MEFQHLASLISPTHFSLNLMPTEQCNFRCVYCYEDFKIGKMKPSIIQGIKNLIARRMPELKTFSIEWFGGEPLAGRDVIYDIGGFVMQLIQNDYRHVSYTSSMTTNGFLLKPEVADRLLGLRVRHFQISLDGPEEIHNKTRLRMNGGGTFKVIWHHLEMLSHRSDAFKVVLRVHMTPDNEAHLSALLRQIKETFGHDDRFKVFLKPIANLGGPHAGTFGTLSYQEVKARLAELYALCGEEMKAYPEVRTPPALPCYAAKLNHLVIRANGRIAKCTVAFDDARNDIGEIQADGSVIIDQDKLGLWTRGLVSHNSKELQCPWVGLPSLHRLTNKGENHVA